MDRVGENKERADGRDVGPMGRRHGQVSGKTQIGIRRNTILEKIFPQQIYFFAPNGSLLFWVETL